MVYWLEHLAGPFFISALLVILLAGKKWRVNSRFLSTIGAAVTVTVTMGALLPMSPWIGTLMVSTMVGVAFRYW
jgi:hypothetical protein